MQDKARCETCNAPGPNLWLCLHSNCLYVGCGESSEDHSCSHTEVIHHLRFSLCIMIPQRRKLSITLAVADPRGGRPLRTKIFLISCSFWENPANLYVGASPPPPRLEGWPLLLRGILDPPLVGTTFDMQL